MLSISMITKEALRILENELGFAKGVNRSYDDTFANAGAKIGSVINVRKPVRFTTVSGPALNIQDITDQSVAVTLGTQQHVDFQFTSKDMLLNVDDFSARYVKPAINALANKIDYDGLSDVALNVPNFVGVPQTVPATALLFLQARQKLAENACPMDGDISVVLNPAGEAGIVDGLKGLFAPQAAIGGQYEKGEMGRALGMNFRMDQNVQSHTVGALGGSGVSHGTNQTGSNISTTAWTTTVTNLLLPGDIITFANTYAVNPVSFQSTGALKQFVVTAAVSSASGAALIPISPAVVTNGPYQNVNQAIADSSAILIFGAASTYASYVSPVNVAYHRDAYCLAMADLELPGAVEMAARANDSRAGMSLRVVRAYDIVNDQHPCRIDVLYGWKAIYPELACRIQG